ncbi:MAG: phosphotransferase [Deferribacteres bacterium]|nr:phosphotransferase [Deferribacteres bacterium]
MSENREKIMGNCILHSSDCRNTLFVFQDGDAVPSYLIKIYDKSRQSHLGHLRELTERINLHGSDVLGGSVPRILRCGETNGFYFVHEEYIDAVPMEMDAGRKRLSWEKAFLQNLKLAATWIGHFHKNFRGERRFLFKRQDIMSLLDKAGAFLETSFLEISDGDVEVASVVSHGDFRPANILKRGQGISVIDWDDFRPEGLPLFDLMEFILRYIHSHYKFEKERVILDQEVFLKYFNLFYVKRSRLSESVRKYIGIYSGHAGLNEKERDTLLLLWLCNMLRIS